MKNKDILPNNSNLFDSILSGNSPYKCDEEEHEPIKVDLEFDYERSPDSKDEPQDSEEV